MKKDFDNWHKAKELIHENKSATLFHEREIWWCSLGVNVGFEQDGSGENFARPVIIVKKFNLDACLVIPLTAHSKKGKYYFDIGIVGEKKAVAVLSQIRFVDRKRLTNKIGTLNDDIFNNLIGSIIVANFKRDI